MTFGLKKKSFCLIWTIFRFLIELMEEPWVALV